MTSSSGILNYWVMFSLLSSSSFDIDWFPIVLLILLMKFMLGAKRSGKTESISNAGFNSDISSSGMLPSSSCVGSSFELSSSLCSS